MVFNYSPFEILLVDAANQYGLDKKLFNERLDFAVNNLLPVVKQHKYNTGEFTRALKELTNKAATQAQFASSMYALHDVVNHKATGYLVGQDSTSSGAQMYSLLFRCLTGMINTGCINSGKVPDIYTQTALSFFGACDKSMRDKIKKAMIPRFYESRAIPRKVFGEDYIKFEEAYAKTLPAAAKMSKFICDAWNELAKVYEWELPDGFTVVMHVLETKKERLPFTDIRGKDHKYTYQHKVNSTKKKGAKGTKALSANVIHSFDGFLLRELVRRCNYDKGQLVTAVNTLKFPDPSNNTQEARTLDTINVQIQKLKHLEELYLQQGFVSAVAFEYITDKGVSNLGIKYRQALQQLATELLKKESFEVMTIHDDFRCHPAHAIDLKKQYNQLLKEVYECTWGAYIMRKLTGKPWLLPSVDLEISDMILEAEYALG